jgi:hypothetical protein
MSEENMIVDMWPEGKTFTVGMTVRNPSEIYPLFASLHKDDLVCGCKVNHVDFTDRHELLAEKENLMEALTNKFNEDMKRIINAPNILQLGEDNG